MRTINWWDFDKEYELSPLVKCKGGGGGGSSSGTVDYPAYMETIHEAWLGAAGDVSIDLTSAIATAHSNSPFTGLAAYDPELVLSSMVETFEALSAGDDWDTVIAAVLSYIDDSIISDTYIDAEVDAQSDYLDDEYTNNILPEFESGMRDIGAVMTSSFVLGKAFIVATKARDVAKYRSELSLAMNRIRADLVARLTESKVKDILGRMSWDKEVATLNVELGRIQIVAYQEETNQNAALDERDARWDLEVFAYGANMMASISGGTTDIVPSQPTQVQSAIGGALSGAATGAMVGGVPGAIAGGLLGLGASFL